MEIFWFIVLMVMLGIYVILDGYDFGAGIVHLFFTKTEEEKKEQAELRQEYLAAVRKNLRAQLNNIDIQEKDGSIVNLGEKYGRKKGN